MVVSREAGREVAIGPHRLPGSLTAPTGGCGLVVFAHGSGSSRLSPRNRQVADAIAAVGLGTLLFDLLRDDEARDRRRVFDILLLAERVGEALDWAAEAVDGPARTLGLFGASTGAAADRKSVV